MELFYADSNNPLKKATFDIRRDYADPEPLIFIDDIPIITRGNISAIVGPPKSKKTFLATLIIGAYLRGGIDPIFAPYESGQVLWIDTEQAAGHCARIYRRLNLLRSNPDDLYQKDVQMLMLREFSTTERLQLTEKAISQFNPDIVVIDGIADLIQVNNDEAESAMLQDFLLAQSKLHDCHIINIIHSNNGSDKARGHTGSNLMRKCESILNISAIRDDVARVSFTTRDRQPKTLAFSIDDQGIPLPTEIVERKYVDPLIMFNAILKKKERLKYSDLLKRIVEYREEVHSPISTARAKQIVANAAEEKIISKNSSGFYSIGGGGIG